MSLRLFSFKDAIDGFKESRFEGTPLWTHELPCIKTTEKREEFLGKLKVVRFAMTEATEQKLNPRDALHAARTALNKYRGLDTNVMQVAVSAFDPEWVFAGQPKSEIQGLAGCVCISRSFCVDFDELEHKYDIWAD